MAEITKVALKVDNNTSFPNNNNGAITPSILRAFNTNMIDSLVDEVGYTLDSGSWNQQIDALEQFTASAQSLTTGSLLITASAVSNVITFTKGNGTTFNVTVADTTDLSQLNQATASLQAFTQSANIRLNNLESTTASLNSSITQLNASSASQQASINNLNTTTASLLVETQNLELFSASALISITNLNQSSASQQISIDSLTSKTGSYATTGSNIFVGANTFTSISASSFISASQFVGDGTKITGITASISMPILDEGIPQGNAFSMNFTGSGISALVIGGTAVISVNTPDSGTVNNLTASFNAYTSSTDAKFLAVQASTASLNSFTASFNSATFVGTASFNAYTASNDQRVTSLETNSASVNTSVTNLNSFSSSVLTQLTTLANVTSSLISKTGSYATTGSNTFVGNQTITGNITAFSASFTYLQTTFESSSVIYSSGSNIFGDATNDTQTLNGTVIVSGSQQITGSLFISGNINMVNGADIVTHHVRAQGSNGLELQTSAGTIIVAMGAGGGTQAGFVGALSANSFSSSTINGLGDPLAFSTSVDSRLDSLEGVSGSFTTTASFNSYTSSNDQKVDSLIAATGSYATTGSNNFIGNQRITGSLTISSSATNDLIVIGRQIITGSANFETCRVTLDNTSTFIDTTRDTGTGALITAYASTGSQGASLTLGVYDSPGFNTDIELNINVDTGSGILFNDFDNVSAFNYVPFMSVAPNLGTNPAPVMTRGLQVTGSTQVQNFTASLQQGYTYVGNASGRTTTVATSSFATNVSNLATTGSNSFNGNQTITGSLILSSSAAVELQVIGNMVVTGSAFGNVVALSITSNTASMDLNLGNYFTLTLAGTATTHISASNVQPGVSATLVITTGTNSSASLAPTMLQPSGSSYSATNGSGKKDVLSIVAVASGVPFVVSTKNMI